MNCLIDAIADWVAEQILAAFAILGATLRGGR